MSPTVTAALIEAAPSTLAALLAWRAAARAKSVHRTQRVQSRRLAKIDEQTNGALIRKVRQAVSDVIAEHPNLVTEHTVAEVLADLVNERVERDTVHE